MLSGVEKDDTPADALLPQSTDNPEGRVAEYKPALPEKLPAELPGTLGAAEDRPVLGIAGLWMPELEYPGPYD